MRLIRLLVMGVTLLAGIATAQVAAQTAANDPQLAVFPFSSSEPRLGFAVADRLTHSFTEASIPPELALGLVPPLLLQQASFISPLELLGNEGTASRFAATFLREALGVDTAVTGRVQLTGAGLELKLFVARPDGAESFLFHAPEAFPDRLVAQAQRALSGYAGLTPEPDARLSIDLSSSYGTFIDGLVALGSGFPDEALPLLRRAGAALRAEPRWRARAEALQRLVDQPAAAGTRYPRLAAVVALNTQPFSEAAVSRAFAESQLPFGTLWQTLLAVQTGDAETARRGFAALGGYPYAEVQALLYRLDKTAATALKTALQNLLKRYPDALSVRVSGLFLAQGLSDASLEQTLATRLTELAPAFAYPYERLSQLAFDRNDPRAAAVALRSATRLEPQSDLYMTNLGWAYYLLGALEASETASAEAVRLNPGEVIARYNLGLVQTVTGRLELALNTYAQATELDLAGDNQLDPAATEDLQHALVRYPEVPGIHYVLGTLLEISGKLGPAAAQFERFAAQAQGPLVTDAEARVQTLRAPAPPLTLAQGVQLGVGAAAKAVAAYVPGDLLYARFELSTPGDALPAPLQITLTLADKAGSVVRKSSTTEQALPPNTVALEIADAALLLPPTLAPGRYRLEVSAQARGRVARTTVPVRVSGRPPSLVRQLIGRGVTLRSLSSGQVLYADTSLSDAALLGVLRRELARAETEAAQTLPPASSGRFAGQGGAALFSSSSEQDVRDFLSFILQQGANADGPFAELYARWALAGAPVPQPR